MITPTTIYESSNVDNELILEVDSEAQAADLETDTLSSTEDETTTLEVLKREDEPVKPETEESKDRAKKANIARKAKENRAVWVWLPLGLPGGTKEGEGIHSSYRVAVTDNSFRAVSMLHG